MKRPLCLLLGVSLLATACGDDSDAASGTTSTTEAPGGVELVKAELERRTPGADAPVDEVVAGMREFVLKLAATQPDGNLVVSPTSIAVAFAMAEAGASEATAAEIANVFGFPAQPGVHEAMNALTAALDAANQPGEDGESQVILELANAVWGQQGSDFGAPFLDVLATDYGTGVQATDFAGDTEASRAAINTWVDEVTRGRIPELVPNGMLSQETLAVLVNAIYLKAAWETPFTEDLTTDEPFHLADGSAANVPMMNTSSLSTRAIQADGYAVVELPYAGNQLSMVVMVPNEGTTLADFERQLSGARLAEIIDGLQQAQVNLALPRWDNGTALDLAGPMSSLGLRIPGGDLSGIAPGVTIGAAVHAANITVDEAGTEAAAATAIAGVTSAAPGQEITVRVDRPFVYVIQHNETGIPLFYGRVADPGADPAPPNLPPFYVP